MYSDPVIAALVVAFIPCPLVWDPRYNPPIIVVILRGQHLRGWHGPCMGTIDGVVLIKGMTGWRISPQWFIETRSKPLRIYTLRTTRVRASTLVLIGHLPSSSSSSSYSSSYSSSSSSSSTHFLLFLVLLSLQQTTGSSTSIATHSLMKRFLYGGLVFLNQWGIVDPTLSVGYAPRDPPSV